MNHFTVHMKDRFPFLGENGRDPQLTVYLLDNLVEMGRGDWLRPTVLLCPGGAYVDVSSRESEPIAMQFAAKGYNVAILKYSCSPHRFPTQLREAAAAMELLYENSEQWHCDTGRIAIMGFSAGGHLAGHYSNCFDCEEVRAVFPDSKPVQVSILCYPVITGDPAHRHLGSFQNLSGHEEPTQADLEKLSVERHVSDRTPPAFLWHTAADGGVPVMNSLLYAQQLSAHGIPFALHVYPYGHHGLSTVDAQTNNALEPKVAYAAAWMDELMQFLKHTL